MDFISALDIAASGLSAERTHINLISMNLANAKTTRTSEGGPYRRKSLVYQATQLETPFNQTMQDALDQELKGVKVTRIMNDPRPLKRVYEPGHPDADEEGYVKYPDINVVEEMANLMTAMRSYEANVTAVTSTKSMFTKALDLGR